MDLQLPWFTNHWWVLSVFVVSLIALHLLLVRFRPLSSLGWRKVDYIWLAMALLGVMGSVSTNRATVSKRFLDLLAARPELELRQIRNAAEFGTSPAVCRTFVRSELSPPPDVMTRTQREYDEQCAWFKRLLPQVANIDKTNTQPLEIEKIAGPPPAGGEPWAYTNLKNSVAIYNELLHEIARLKKTCEPSDLEVVLQFLGPALLAVAVALRMTKVTGEIALERARQNRCPE